MRLFDISSWALLITLATSLVYMEIPYVFGLLIMVIVGHAIDELARL